MIVRLGANLKRTDNLIGPDAGPVVLNPYVISACTHILHQRKVQVITRIVVFDNCLASRIHQRAEGIHFSCRPNTQSTSSACRDINPKQILIPGDFHSTAGRRVRVDHARRCRSVAMIVGLSADFRREEADPKYERQKSQT